MTGQAMVRLNGAPSESSLAAEWRVVSHLELAALPTAAASARKHARAIALEFGLPALADTTELVVSEIVTNAVRAGSGLRASNLTIPVVRLWLASDLCNLLISVWDGSSQMPVRQDASPDDELGRGLLLVDNLASEWGAYPEACGKVVWVLIK
jgi:anti-sigma regulatory factor (Ser/Thr protein kinase)